MENRDKKPTKNGGVTVVTVCMCNRWFFYKKNHVKEATQKNFFLTNPSQGKTVTPLQLLHFYKKAAPNRKKLIFIIIYYDKNRPFSLDSASG